MKFCEISAILKIKIKICTKITNVGRNKNSKSVYFNIKLLKPVFTVGNVCIGTE